MRRNTASSAGLWKIPHARRLRRPLAASRAAHPAAPGRRAGSLADPIETTGFWELLHESLRKTLVFFLSFLFIYLFILFFACSPYLYEESFQQINEKLAMPVLLWGGGNDGGISLPCDFIVLCVL